MDYRKMNLESLANEILLDLFEYLKGIHLLRAFSGLNQRFKNLIITHFQTNFLDFRSISKIDFDDVCQQQLPLFIDRIMSLCLDNDDRTSQQTIRFLSHNFTLSRFTCLQKLTLRHLETEIMNEVFREFNHLPHLIHLRIIDSSISFEWINTILRLPKLTHCSLDALNDQHYGCKPTIVSSSLKYLSIKFIECRNDLRHLLKCLPSLHHLSIYYTHDRPIRLPLHHIEDNLIQIPSLEIFKLDLVKSIGQLEGLICYMPNLCKLTIDVVNHYVIGSQWQKLITNYLPKLKKFYMRMQFTLTDETEIDQQVDQILDLFRTSFWIDEHQWFVRCHWDVIYPSKDYYIYTLPHLSTNNMTSDIYKPYKSTCPNENDYHSYNYVHKLNYIGDILSSNFLSNSFPNIYELTIELPMDTNFLSVFPTLNHLKRLVILSTDDTITSECQLQELFDKASYLPFLKIKGWIPNKVTSKSIRQLDFYGDYSLFNDETCTELCNSSLGIQCEFLSVLINDRNYILYFLNNMKNLRILKFRYQVRKQRYDLIQDEFMQWLQESMPSTCTISKDFENGITLWIR